MDSNSIKAFSAIPGIGKSIAQDLVNIGIQSLGDLKGKDPERLYEESNRFEGLIIFISLINS